MPTVDEPEMRDLAYEELEHLKEQKEHLLEEVRIALLPKDIMDEKNAIVTIQGGAGGDEADGAVQPLLLARHRQQHQRAGERQERHQRQHDGAHRETPGAPPVSTVRLSRASIRGGTP